MSAGENYELTVVEYARLYGLSIDHLADRLPISHIEALQEHIPHTLTDERGLTCIDFPLQVHTDEILAVDKDAARLLQGARNGLTSSKEVESLILPLLDSRQSSKFQVEAPLLRTDHASDFRAFAEWEQPYSKDGSLPMEPLDDEMDEGLDWSERMKTLPSELMKELKDGRIELLKETLLYLQATIRDSWTEDDERKALENASPYRRNTAVELVTPPLLPMRTPVTPYIPSSPACHLPLLSDPASLISDDLRAAEKVIFEQDSLISTSQYNTAKSDSPDTLVGYATIGSIDISLPAEYFDSDEQSPAFTHVKADDRKVEVPLTPPMPASTLPKTVTFSEILEEMLLDTLPPAGGQNPSEVDSEKAVDTFLQEAFREAADNANRRLEQEQLQEADSTMRVEVPIMDFKLPDPPWKNLQQKSNSDGLLLAQRTMVTDIHVEYGQLPTWPGVSKLINRLRWTVFPCELAVVVLDEEFGDDDVLGYFLKYARDQMVVDSSGLTWKPPGFRILEDNEDDEDDLELGHFDPEHSQQVASPLKKRKNQYEEDGPTLLGSAGAAAIGAIREDILMNPTITEYQKIGMLIQGGDSRQRLAPQAESQLCMGDKKMENDTKTRTNLLFGGPFSVSDALENFLQVRASKKQKPTDSSYFVETSLAKRSLTPRPHDALEQSTFVEQPQIAYRTFPVPSVKPPSIPTSYIISSAILKHRVLIRTLSVLIPAIVLIERDWTAHSTTEWLPNSVTRSPVTSPLSYEADFIVSPSTGIILTTLQKIKQKPLPGQKSKSAFKQRVEKVSARYERLVVLVSEGCADESTNGLAELDTLALAEVTGFCGSLETSTIVQFVAGGEETLGKWLAATMLQYGIHGEANVLLLQDETLWELVLRRAGMNAFASQVVLGALKAPEGVDMEGGSKAGMFGITAFVEMAQEERRRIFEGLLGGGRVLERVGMVLDSRWV